MRVRRAVAAGLAFVAFLSFSADAEADRHHYTVPAGEFIRFDLEGANGYSISIDAGPDRYVSLTTVKGGIATEYSVQRAYADADHVKARFPGLGLISVSFHQRGPARHPLLAGCGRPPATVRKGVVRGLIKFVGEREYTQVEAHAAHAETMEWERLRCRYGKPGRQSSRREWTNEFHVWKSDEPVVSFSARKYRSGVLRGGRVAFTAMTGTFRRSFHITRSALVFAPTSTFQIPEPGNYPEHVILSPPPPFTGTGTFARTPESVFTWEGNLSIQFPGIDPIPLTGPRFSPRYCALRSCIEQEAAESEPGFPRPAR